MPRLRAHVTGTVQGVGFRPFVFRLAQELGLSGFVLNDPSGVWVEAQGTREALDALIRRLSDEAPPLARVQSVEAGEIPEAAGTAFTIRESPLSGGEITLVSPDVATCADCRAEISDPADRRHRYPFTNCTNCGPRFTIIKGLPYDRPLTTMSGFALCPDCAREYGDPTDRRFHAQPVCCPVCGPQVGLVDSRGDTLAVGERAFGESVKLLKDGKILAVKGLGGYHLACDALNERAVAELRKRKVRLEKPFALMLRDLDEIRRYCAVDEAAADLLESNRAPIVLLPMKEGERVAPSVALGQRRLGVMPPYTPLHHVLMADFGGPLVLTSGNRADEPIAYTDADALARLGDIADAFLTHDRPIHLRCDDTVASVLRGGPYLVRRSRGWAPEPIHLAKALPVHLLAVGAEQKNTFALGRERLAFVSHHIGDMENPAVLASFEEGIGHFQRLFKVRPEAVAYDPHPEYLPSKWALERDLPKIAVQHHRAHVAACLADAGHDGPAIGVAWDGTGYGDDGAIWGAELFLAAERRAVGADWPRICHLDYVPLAGGARAVRQPWRMAAVWLEAAGLDPYGVPGFGENFPGEEWGLVRVAAERGINSPPTSSGGRLFDAVAAILGVRSEALYEGQPAVELEQLADPAETGAYGLELDATRNPWRWDARPLFRSIVEDLQKGTAREIISARFHRGLARGIAGAAVRAARENGIGHVALTGGCFQNLLLTEWTAREIEVSGLTALLHRRVPPNDGGISLGQLFLAGRILRET
ncbi:MAG TPA: carbamoyltransferase HypF [bacterium]|nr:carbamoyltransferase HypF [bacterium]